MCLCARTYDMLLKVCVCVCYDLWYVVKDVGVLGPMICC